MIIAGGLSVFDDSGEPVGHDSNYTTIVIVHGLVWHGATFAKLRPIARARGVRVIALNRRDYPGARPYTSEERALLPSIPQDLKPPTAGDGTPLGAEGLDSYVRQRAHELYECLQALVEERNIPPFSPASKKGGIVLVGWSLGCTWISGLLAHVSSFPAGHARLQAYIRRVIWQDPLSHILGYAPPARDPYVPTMNTSLEPQERMRVFTQWITSYFSHKHLDSEDGLERRTALRYPPSTFDAMSENDRRSTMHASPGAPGGSDWDLLFGSCLLGTVRNLRKGALYPPRADAKAEDWGNIELRVLWGDRSVWAVPYAITHLRQELAHADREGRDRRPVSVMRLRGANHFAHWGHPEQTLEAYLADNLKADRDI
ncbi:hypothetical protein PYCCODRAFT_1475403 [Trametes coccinea BRFM310]|uniref:Uncharacterized protein n=1 Tax=Trametes coccinea (strain BRFM310) TaxID=1353009 RepID=A0A1Y2IW47_TRAC3|nr:hypothetical protein PYCCODRAFT_1475403 [Trametes coccinea BRFM310]